MAVANLIVRISADIAAFEKNMKAVERTLQKSGQNWEFIGDRMTKGLTLPLVAAVGVATKAAIDFESSFAGIRKTVAATETQFAALSRGMRELAKTIPVNVNELNKIGEAAGQLGIKTEQILDFTKIMAQLGVTTNLSSEQAATSLARFANIMDRVKVTAGTFEFDRLGATIVELGNTFAASEAEIADFGERIAGAGKIAGLTEAQVLAIGTAMASVGVEAEAGGTAVQKVLNEMTEAVATNNKELQIFAATAGLSAKAFSDAFRQDAGAAFERFVRGLGEQGDKAFNTLDLLKLGNERVIRAFISLGNAGDLLTNTLRVGQEAWKQNTALTKEAEQRFKTTASQLTLLKNNAQDVAITFGQAFLPVLNDALTAAKPLVSLMADLASAFLKLPEPVRNTAFAFVGLLASLGPIAFAVGKVQQGWAGFLALMRTIPTILAIGSGAFLGLTTALTGVTTGMTGVAGVTALVTGAISALAAPLTIVIGLFSGWKLGRLIGEFTGLTDAVGRASATFSEWIGLLPEGTAAQYDATRAAVKQAEALKQTGSALNSAADDIKRLQQDISGQRIAQEVENLRLAFAGLPPNVQKTADTMQHVGRQASFLRQQGGRLHPELAALADAFDDNQKKSAGLIKPLTIVGDKMTDLQKKTKALNDQLAGKDLAESAKAWAIALKEPGREAQVLANESLRQDLIRALDAVEQHFGSLAAAGVGGLESIRGKAKALELSLAQIDLIPFKAPNITGGVFDVSFGEFIPQIPRSPLTTPLVESIQRQFDTIDIDTVRIKEMIERVKAGIQQAIDGNPRTNWQKFLIPDPKDTQGWLADLHRLGRSLSEAIGRGIATGDWGQMARDLGREVANFVSQTAAQFINAFVPGLGAMVEPIINGLTQALGKVFDRNKGRDMVEDFAATFGGFDALHRRLNELGADGERLWVTLTQKVGRNNTREAKAAIDEVTAALDAFGTEAERAERRLTGLGKAVDGINRKAELFAEPFKKLQDAMKEAMRGDDGRASAQLAERFMLAARTGQAEFERLGVFVGATFAGIVTETGDAIGAIRQLTPAFDVLKQGVNDFGLSSTGLIDQLLHLFSLVNDEVTGPLLQSIQATGQIFSGLQDAGFMTAELFQTVATDIGAAFRELEVKGGDVAAAMALSQPVLQRLWEAQQIYGEITDDTTRKILKQAEEQGLVGAHMKDVNRQILDVLIAIADVFGAVLPESMRRTQSAAEETAEKVKREFDIGPIRIPIHFEVEDKPNLSFGGGTATVPALAHGGVVRRPTLALVGEAGPEAVVPLSQLGSLERPTSTVIIEADGRTWAEILVPYIPGEVQRFGLA